ncbi:5999_t:CDS:2 [Acaulospora morrowiae]|uniref:5999_t:CDS:1 n=1 Tax=Acaulospora morrowiae TaxID=94023 RepID=A0A9N8ZQD3_9GLOM|nr:5999_t:CDS:2 [Acaulospora morrowiae]
MTFHSLVLQRRPIKPSSLTIFLVFFSSLLFTSPSFQQNVPLGCYEYPDPTNRYHKIPVNCPIIESPTMGDDFFQLQENSDNNMFVIHFVCGAKNPTLCEKVKDTFEIAGSIISSTLTLNTPINVNASFIDFCKTLGKCGNSDLVTLGGATPTRMIPLQDDDGLVRLYPQSLVKQFRFPKHPQFSTFDITATFNSAGGDYWFQGDPIIGPDQQDFLYVVLHELVHGLGFASSWQDYINDTPEALTPDISVISSANSSTLIFNGFFESAFDKYMIDIPTGRRVSAITDQLNEFAGSGTKFSNIQEFYMRFKSSKQYQLALGMMNSSVTPLSLGFLPTGGTKSSDCIILETSLNPYQRGCSVSHVSLQTYNSTCDFLMKYLADRGKDLNTLVASRGNYKSPIGPELLLFFNTLGYASPGYPNPYRPNVIITTNKFNPNVSKNVDPGLQKASTVSYATVTVTITANSAPTKIPEYTTMLLFIFFSSLLFSGVIT